MFSATAHFVLHASKSALAGKRPVLIGAVSMLACGVVAWTVLAGIGKNAFRALTRQSAMLAQGQTTAPVELQRYRLLDGIPVEKGHTANPQPVAIMIENLPVTRPQSGLSGASIVYEALVEGGATRFLAVYAGAGPLSLSKIGPVRSARSYYLEWASEFGPLYGHAGGSPEALRAILDFHMKDFNGIGREARYFWRDRGLSAPHNLFTSNEFITRALHDMDLTNGRPNFRSWFFKDEVPLAQRPASGQFVRIDFSGLAFQAEWRYDQATNAYLRLNAGQIHIDTLTGEQLRAKNVIVQVIPPVLAVGEKGRLTLDVHGSGRAFIFRDGQQFTGIWKKADRLERTLFSDESGNEIQLNRGNTWVEVVPSTQKVEAGTL